MAKLVWTVTVECKSREAALTLISKLNELGHIAVLKERTTKFQEPKG